MTHCLTPKEYEVTKQKLVRLQARLAALRKRTDLHPARQAAAESSYLDMMRQYLREIKLYEATHKDEVQESPMPEANQVN